MCGSCCTWCVSASVCNGDCSYNPSGLYPFPGDNTRFIQCEASSSNQRACTCCKPTMLRCPAGTLYDDTIKVCVGNQEHMQGYGYK